jgi:hypothetical protein
MNPKWGDRVPVGKPRTKHGMTRYFLGNGQPIRPPSEVVNFHEKRMAERFNESLERDYDNVSQTDGDGEGVVDHLRKSKRLLRNSGERNFVDHSTLRIGKGSFHLDGVTPRSI